MEYLEKLQVLKLQLGQMRETVKETRGSLLAETLNIDTHVRYDSKRFRFYVGSNPTDVANSVNKARKIQMSAMDEYNERWKKRCDACSCNPCDGHDRILRVKCPYPCCYDDK